MNTPNQPPPGRYGGPPGGRPGPPPGGQRPPGPPPGRAYGPPPGYRPGPVPGHGPGPGPRPAPGGGPGPTPRPAPGGGPGPAPRPVPGGQRPGYGQPPGGPPPGPRPYGRPPHDAPPYGHPAHGGPPSRPRPPGGPANGGPPPRPPADDHDDDRYDDRYDDPGDGPEPDEPRAGREPKRVNQNLVKAAALVVLLVVVVAAALWLQSSSPSSAEPGDCIKIVDVAEADIEKVDCASPDALFKVAVAEEDDGAKCPTRSYLAYTQSGRNELLLCLSLNASTGDCYQVADNTYRKVDCAAPEASFRVAEVVEGKHDPALCGEAADQALVYPEPPLTICRTTPEVAAT